MGYVEGNEFPELGEQLTELTRKVGDQHHLRVDIDKFQYEKASSRQ